MAKGRVYERFFRGFDRNRWWTAMLDDISEVKEIAVELRIDSAMDTINAIEDKIEESLSKCRLAHDEICDKEFNESFSCKKAKDIIDIFRTELRKLMQLFDSDAWGRMMIAAEAFSLDDPTTQDWALHIQELTKALNEFVL